MRTEPGLSLLVRKSTTYSLDNLTGIINEEQLWSDAAMLEKDRSYVDIGMKAVKQKRSEHRVILPTSINGEYLQE